MDDKISSRIAPTPSGFLHRGNIFNFLIIDEWIKSVKGTLFLRIDDCDPLRCQDQYIEHILKTINFLNIAIDHGPSSLEDFKTNFSQIKKIEEYRNSLKPLQSFLYPCSCSRKDIEKRTAPDYHYDGFCLKYPPKDGIKSALRFKRVDPKEEDFIIWRKDDLPTYQFVSVIHDELEKHNLIIRGNDLIDSTNIQKELAKALGYSSFLKAKFVHHPLLFNNQGQKLSKSQNDFPYSISELESLRTKAKIFIDSIQSTFSAGY